jgi:hypothetical protein
MKVTSCAIAAALMLIGVSARASGQTLTRYVKYEVAGRVAWGILEGDTIRELQGNVFDGAKPNGRQARVASAHQA